MTSRAGNMMLASMAAAVALLCAAGATARAESIWAKRNRNAAYLYRDAVACDVGDSITVLITDSSSFSHKGARELDKETDAAAAGNLTATSRRTGTTASKLFDPYNLTATSSRAFKGSSDYTGSSSFSDVVTTTVIDRLPNGNLVVCGRSERKIAGELASTVLTGVVRPVDLSGENTIVSTRVSQLKIHYETTGPSRSFLDQGWLGRLLNAVWPF